MVAACKVAMVMLLDGARDFDATVLLPYHARERARNGAIIRYSFVWHADVVAEAAF